MAHELAPASFANVRLVRRRHGCRARARAAQAALQRADHAGGDARGVPVHPHHRAEGLEPEGMGQAAQQLVAAVVVNDGLADHRAETCHAIAQPGRDSATMQGQIGTAGFVSHQFDDLSALKLLAGPSFRDGAGY